MSPIARLHRTLLMLPLPALLLAGAGPARAVEELALQLPLLGEIVTARVSELRSPEALWAGDSDLAELNRATDGRIATAIEALVDEPLPSQNYRDSAMVQQLEVLISQLLEVENPVGGRLDATPIAAAASRLQAAGQKVTLISLLNAIPARRVVIRLDRAVPKLRALQQSQDAVERLLASMPKLPAASTTALAPGPSPVRVVNSSLPLPGSRKPLEVVVVRPTTPASLPPVLISHGLWDSPASFLGWARHLASHGAPVLLPRHPGSDISQQAEMLAGRVPPPDPREFLRRPAEVRAVLDGLERGSLPGAEGVPARGVVMIGHSWGATTALQLAGARSLAAPLWSTCGNNSSPLRNISWVLQCSVLPAATPDSLADARIVRVVAVSPPQGLVFELGNQDLQLPVLLVSGSHDLVVPTMPEALIPFPVYPRGASRLVVAEGGTHFNLPAAADSNGGPLRALLLSWVQSPSLSASGGQSDPAGLPLRLLPEPAARSAPAAQ